jgi:hypothetical protein
VVQESISDVSSNVGTKVHLSKVSGEGELHAVGVQAKGEILILPGFMAVECIWTQT